MELEHAKRTLQNSSILSGLDDAILAELLWTAVESRPSQGELVYEENSPLDGTFSVLAEGRLEITQGGEHRKFVAEEDPEEGNYPILGGFAYFHRDNIRTVTVRVASETATLLILTVDQERMANDPAFAQLKERLSTASVRHWSEDQ